MCSSTLCVTIKIAIALSVSYLYILILDIISLSEIDHTVNYFQASLKQKLTNNCNQR